jgi:hypothetical protein
MGVAQRVARACRAPTKKRPRIIGPLRFKSLLGTKMTFNDALALGVRESEAIGFGFGD